ncbi:hypothetical protein HPB47_008472 [Ixodes persulcatus]|uniref:Uncharacterized protein n=1 Tax=Ixodes persulcatus TaxID=34615 RepID=A0AC60P4K6_IXOPE|nr:mediator of RNA polymerase II transcription subunit 30 [Ixodes scapularis]KAG0414343.1 hypothetical protein HPB47_008472 [Ixodes persulcatus]
MASPYQQQVLGGPMGTGMGPPLLSPQQQGGPGFAGAPDAGEPVQALQHKDLNTVMMCRVGQETVQEVVAKAIELFQNLKALQPPTGVASSMAGQEERRLKLQDTLRTVGMLFKRLHRVYNICSDCGPSAGSQYTPIEPDVTLQSLVPMKDEAKTSEEKKPSEVTRSLQEERARLTEQVVIKNRQLKEVLDALRNIIWEINTMLAMRKRHLQFSHRVSSLNPPK